MSRSRTCEIVLFYPCNGTISRLKSVLYSCLRQILIVVYFLYSHFIFIKFFLDFILFQLFAAFVFLCSYKNSLCGNENFPGGTLCLRGL